jgi:hypothetical protein
MAGVAAVGVVCVAAGSVAGVERPNQCLGACANRPSSSTASGRPSPTRGTWSRVALGRGAGPPDQQEVLDVEQAEAPLGARWEVFPGDVTAHGLRPLHVVAGAVVDHDGGPLREDVAEPVRVGSVGEGDRESPSIGWATTGVS